MDEPSPSGRNLAATVGGWSARHRRKAVLGWLAFSSAPTRSEPSSGSAS